MREMVSVGKVLQKGVTGSSGSDTSGSPATALPNGHTKAYVHGIVTYLEGFLGLRLSDLEVDKIWIPKLAQYQRWRLEKAIEYTIDDRGGGRTLAHVCKFLEDLRPGPEPVREDIGYLARLEHKPNPEVGRRTSEYLRKLTKLDIPEERDVCELEFIQGMRRDFPHITWECVRPANKGL